MAGGIFVGSVYATMELQTGGFAGDIARAKNQLGAFDNAAGVSSRATSDWAGQAQQNFKSVADGITGLVKTTAALALAGTFGLGTFVKTAAGLETTSKQMGILIGNTEDANAVFGELYNYTLGKPIAFPDASKAAATLLGYGRSANVVMDDMKTLSTLSIVNGADLQALSLVFGQVTSRGALFGQDALQLINNKIPLTTILARKLGISMEQAAEKINGGQISAETFTEAMTEYAQSLDISSMSDTFDNRMLSMRGSIRAFGNAILGVRIDPIKGLVIESGGLFDRISQGIADLGPKLKEITPMIKGAIDYLLDNGETVLAFVGGLAGAFAAAKIGEFSMGILKVAGGFGTLMGWIPKATAAQWGFNAAMTANPVGLIVLGVTALGAALGFLQVKFNIFGKLIDWLKQVGGFINDNKGAFIALGVAVGALAAPFALAAAKAGIMLAVSKGMMIFGVLKNVIMGATVAFRALGLAMMANPIGLVIAAVAALVAGFIYLWNNNEGFRNFFIGMWEGIKTAAAAVASWFTGTLVPAFQSAWEGIKAGAAAVAGFFTGIWNGIVAGATAIGSTIATIFNGIVAVITTVFTTIMNIYNTYFKPVVDGIIYIITALGTIVFTIFTGIAQVVWTVVSTIVQIIGVVLYGIVMFIWNNILTPIGKFFAQTWNTIAGVVSSVAQRIWSVVTTVFTAVWNTISSIFNAVRGVVSAAWNFYWSIISSVAQRIWSIVTSIFNGIRNTISSVFNAVRGVVSSVWNSIYGTVSGIARSIWSTVSNTFNNVVTAVRNGMTNAWNAVTGFVGRFLSAGKDVIDGLVRGVANGKDAVVGKIKDICAGALDSVKSFFGIKSPSRVMAKMGGYLMEGFSDGVSDQTKMMERTMYKASDSITKSFSPTLSADATADFRAVKPGAVRAGLFGEDGEYGSKTEFNAPVTIHREVDANRAISILSGRQVYVDKGLVVSNG